MGCMLRHVSKISATRVMIRKPKSFLSFRFSTFVISNTWCPYRLYNKKLCNFLKWSIFYPFSIIYLLPLKLLDPHYWWLCGTNTHAEPKSNERNADRGNRNPKKGEKKNIWSKHEELKSVCFHSHCHWAWCAPTDIRPSVFFLMNQRWITESHLQRTPCTHQRFPSVRARLLWAETTKAAVTAGGSPPRVDV